MHARGRHRRARPSRLARLGRHTGAHPRVVVLLWVVVAAACFAGASGALGGESLFARLSSGQPSVPGPAQTGREMVDAAHPTGESLLLQVSGVDGTSGQVRRTVRDWATALAATPGVAEVRNPYLLPGGIADPAAAPLLSRGSRGAPTGFLTTVQLRTGDSGAAYERALASVRTQLEALGPTLPGAKARVGGNSLLVDEITSQIETDLRLGEGVALPVSLLVMVLVFGGFLAAGMPIVGAVASIAGALLSLLGFSYLLDLDATVVNVVTVMGLGLCIDYGLLMVSRFREELRAASAGAPASSITPEQVVAATSRTTAMAGRTILFSGLTVAISLAGLTVFTAQIMKAIGAAGVSVVLVALLVALTLVPALCALFARRLLRKGSEVAPDEGVFSRLARRVQRRPVLVIVAVLAVLVVAALPVLGTRLTSSGADLLPKGSQQRSFFEDLYRDYPAMREPAATVVTRAPLPEVARWAATTASRLPGVTSVDPPVRLSSSVLTVGLRTGGDPLADPARRLTSALTGPDRPPFPAYVTGRAAYLQDFVTSMRERAPVAFGLIVLATFVLLFLMTGSLVIPLKALLTNVVSLGASLGIVVWVFQHGHLEGLLGFSSVGAIESTIPLLALAFGFGLSMDYEVFLLSRITELHRQGRSTSEAVVLGLQRSGRIITCAAVLIVIVFGGFVTGKLLVIKETGIALAVAVLLDATLVRMLLVPATMTLLGQWNWWAPGPLRRWHDRHGLDATVTDDGVTWHT